MVPQQKFLPLKLSIQVLYNILYNIDAACVCMYVDMYGYSIYIHDLHLRMHIVYKCYLSYACIHEIHAIHVAWRYTYVNMGMIFVVGKHKIALKSVKKRVCNVLQYTVHEIYSFFLSEKE